MMKQFQSNSYLFGGNAPYVEELYELSRQSGLGPGEVARLFRRHAGGAGSAGEATRDVPHAPVVESFALQARTAPTVRRAVPSTCRSRAQTSVRPAADRRYRFLGTRWADLDP